VSGPVQCDQDEKAILREETPFVAVPVRQTVLRGKPACERRNLFYGHRHPSETPANRIDDD
jgi:hypothetical protein